MVSSATTLKIYNYTKYLLYKSTMKSNLSKKNILCKKNINHNYVLWLLIIKIFNVPKVYDTVINRVYI